MNAETWVLIGVGFLGALGTIYGAWRAGRAVEHTPYSALAERVTALELADQTARKRIAGLETRESQLVRHLKELLEWVDSGAQPPPPSPPLDLAEFLADWPNDRRYK